MTDKENEAETKSEVAELRRGKRRRSNKRLAAGELQLRENKNRYGCKLESPRKPHRRRDERNTRRNKQRRRSSAVRQVLKPPAPPSLSLPIPTQPFPTPPQPSPPWPRGSRHGRKMGWRREETQHTRMEAELLT